MTDGRQVASLPDDVVALGTATLHTLHARGLSIPGYDRSRLRPRIVHLGVGGFHRSHLAVYCHQLAERGSDWGIRGIGLLPHDAAIAAALRVQDHLYALTLKSADRSTTEIIGSIIDYRLAGTDPEPAVDAVADPDTAILSMTITEAGYGDDAVSRRTFDIVAAGLDRRRTSGLGPLTVLSCDNLPGNGDTARARVLEAAIRLGGECRDWIAEGCTFPNSMVDRITPVTTIVDRDHLEVGFGLIDRWPVVAEPFRQWALEDDFVAGRPAFQDVGALFTDDVHAWELYKLRLLNGCHTALAYLSALARITYVDEAVTDGRVGPFLTALLLEEAAPMVAPIPGHPREDYVATVLARFANAGVRDQVARLCVDGTSKVAAFLVPTISAQIDCGGQVDLCALAVAGWAHYLSDLPEEAQASDVHAGPVRQRARAALADPSLFLADNDVFPRAVACDVSFGAAFAQAHRSISDVGPLAAITAALARRGR